MSESQNKTPRKSIDRGLIVGIIAIAINIITVSVYVFQTRIMERQQHASVWPYLEWRAIYNEDDGFRLAVKNNGVGPALITSSEMYLDGEPIDAVDTLLVRLLGTRNMPHLEGLVDNRVLPPGEDIYLLVSEDLRWAELLFSGFNEHVFEWMICYESIYGEQWQCLGTEVIAGACQ